MLKISYAHIRIILKYNFEINKNISYRAVADRKIFMCKSLPIRIILNIYKFQASQGKNNQKLSIKKVKISLNMS